MKIKPSLKENSEAVKSLVSLASEAQEICKLILESGGEISQELEARLDFNNAALLGKVDNYVFIEDHMEAHAALWKRKADGCKAIYERFVQSQEKLRDRVKIAMRQLEKDELKGNNYRYKLSHLKPKLVITDESKIPSECKMIVTTAVIDKEKIRSLLQDGIDVPGTTLEPVFSLRTYENAED